ncbi:aldehyde dehydrogenase family protein [Aromatoleum toluolicum]|uniref:Aldehyde dehydrogenase n=1 Tax=Aromatoleum toluolicum TaxID=90060 RepID=A0ABX1NJS4_9RHOO|nr:aldehyde dehydrogenase family protein [Aromatoleum toluolicum]NMF99415.1 aldehyde dehydrogenase family protein [Aromatoleum toluolicum]
MSMPNEAPYPLLEALRVMKDAQRRAGEVSAELRIDRLTRLLELLRSHADDFCAALDADFGGRPREISLMNDVMATFNSVKYARKHVRHWMKPERRGGVFPFSLFGARVDVHRMPKGVIGILGTWNVPLFTTLAPLAFVLAAGNRAMLKPSELVPRTAQLLCDAVRDAFSEDEVAVFNGDASVAAAFSALPFDHLVLTGSSATGVRVMRAAAEQLVPVTLELGGKSPVIVGRSADIGVTAERILLGKTMNAGQICVSPDTVYVPREALERFVSACVEVHSWLFPPDAGAEALTAIVDERHRARLDAYLDELTARGARIVDCGGGLAPSGRRRPLHLVIDPPRDCLMAREEIFGPLLQVESYTDIDEVIGRINDGPRPLALYYFGADKREERRVLEHTLSGGVAINDVLIQVAAHDAPFGGVGSSGMGVYHGREGFEQFSHPRTVYRSGWCDPRKALGLTPPYRRQLYERLLKTLRV